MLKLSHIAFHMLSVILPNLVHGFRHSWKERRELSLQLASKSTLYVCRSFNLHFSKWQTKNVIIYFQIVNVLMAITKRLQLLLLLLLGSWSSHTSFSGLVDFNPIAVYYCRLQICMTYQTRSMLVPDRNKIFGNNVS